MKNINYLASLLSVFLLVGCANFATVVTKKNDSSGLTPDYAKGMKQKEIKQEALKNQKIETPSITVGENIKNGEFIQKDNNGNLLFKTFVQNKCFDKYMDVFYPNGKLRTHTPLVECKANGVSQGYTSDGVLRTEIPYKNGLAEGVVKIYNQKGDVIKQILYHEGYPSL